MLKDELIINDIDQLIEKICYFMKSEMTKGNYEGFVIGNSGGVDSAVVISLALKAVGKEKVLQLFLPERDTSKQSYIDAKLLADRFNTELVITPITSILRKAGIYKLERPALIFPEKVKVNYVKNRRKSYKDNECNAFIKTLKGDMGNTALQKDITYYSAKNRIRMTVIYANAEERNYMVLGTANKSEWLTGLFIKHGDGACDTAPIMDLYKSQVYQLARALNTPDEIIKKKPSSDLAPGLNDEDTLDMSYMALDQILLGISKGLSDEVILGLSDVTTEEIKYVRKMISASERTRNMPTYFKTQ